jgi:hypothetical protein
MLFTLYHKADRLTPLANLSTPLAPSTNWALQMVSQMSAQAASGLHGTGSRFMPVVQIDEEEHYPRSIAVAGMYPGITAEVSYAQLQHMLYYDLPCC